MPEIRITSPDLKRLVRLYERAPGVVGAELRRAMTESVLIAEGEIVARTPVDTGRLRASITHHVRGAGTDIKGVVGSTNVPYAPAVEFGTRPYTIVPRNAKALRFMVGNRVVFARRVNHPGRPGRHMFSEGAKAAAPRIRAAFRRALWRAISKMRGR